jgi:thiamine phosphate synthase YjbQ (UPF0047 family)
MVKRLSLRMPGPGLHEVTDQVRGVVRDSGTREGLCTVFIQHTSASLTIQENADPSARRDLENWLNRLVPERDSLYTHTAEGPELGLGTWQGIYVWEHRRHSSTRHLLVHVGE